MKKRFMHHLWTGIRHGYPLCCVLRFSIDSAFKNSSGQARGRGLIDCGLGYKFVPCLFFHTKSHSAWRPLRMPRLGWLMIVDGVAHSMGDRHPEDWAYWGWEETCTRPPQNTIFFPAELGSRNLTHAG